MKGQLLPYQPPVYRDLSLGKQVEDGAYSSAQCITEPLIVSCQCGMLCDTHGSVGHMDESQTAFGTILPEIGCPSPVKSASRNVRRLASVSLFGKQHFKGDEKQCHTEDSLQNYV
jgi:hypothetical protein